MFIAAIALSAGVSTLGHVAQQPPVHNAFALLPAPHSLVTHGKSKALASGTTIPVTGPRQLALDSQGNLYVANSGMNDVLIYNSSFVQQTPRTISNGLLGPVGVAVDPYGNVFVSNPSTNEVIRYNMFGVEQVVYSNGLNVPTALAVDAISDLFVVNNDFTSISTFNLSSKLDSSVGGTAQPTSVAIWGNQLIETYANGTLANFTSIDADSLVSSPALGNGTYALPANTWVNGTAVDSSGGLWFTSLNNQTIIRAIYNPLSETLTAEVVFKSLNYVPAGIAVDSVRGYVYVSDASQNMIHVYNAKTGALIKHIT